MKQQLSRLIEPIRRYQQKLNARSKIYIALGLICVLISTVFTPLSPFPTMARSANPAPPVPPASSRPLQAPGQNKLYNPYWYFDRNTTATLEIANHAEADRTLTPVLFLRGSERVALDPVKVQAQGTVRISLNDALRGFTDDLAKPEKRSDRREENTPSPRVISRWGDGSRRGSLWGSALLECDTTDHVFSAIVSEDARESLSISTPFSPERERSPILTSAWYLPTSRSRVIFALQNTSADDVAVVSFLIFGGRMIKGSKVQLPGNSSRLIELRDLLPAGESTASLPQTGAVRFVALNAEVTIEGRTAIYDQRSGFSIPLEMRPLLHYRGNILQLPGALFGQPDEQMRLPRQTRFSTRLLLTNTASTVIEVRPTLHGASVAGKQISWDDPAITLGPYESRVVDLKDAHERSGIADGYVGVELAHNGNLIDLMAEAVTTDQTKSLSFYEPFHDGRALGRGQHSAVFDLAGGKSTLEVIRNVTDQPVQYQYKISYQEGGSSRSYLSPSQNLAARESKVIDLEALRNVADAEGRRLPATATFGHLLISSGRKSLVVSGVTFDPDNGVTSNSIPPIDDDCCLTCGGGGACPDECTPCCDHETNLCWRNLAICEGAATGALILGLNACENASFCQQGNPAYNEDECNRCKTYVWEAYAVASGVCGTVFGLCMSDRGNTCATKKKPNPANSDT
ncbi:MAG: hypothetical protein ACREEM_39095 [Blastocatellia bacterium]